jgi:hypothetical protein
MIGKLLLGSVLAGAVVLQDGLLEVKVDEKGKDGSHVHLYLPATLATWGVHLAPREKIRLHLQGAEEQLALARVISRELEKAPDTLFVAVDSAEQHVRVEKHWGSLRVDVDDAGETVHLSVPLRAARRLIEDLEADARSAQPGN